jgi:subtilisin family serine protease
LYPAALPTVISVGSLDVAGAGYSNQPSSFSNAATVVAPGALLHLADKQAQRIVYAGTSFAAPVVTLFVALDQMTRHPVFSAGNLASFPITVHSLATTALSDLPLACTFTSGATSAIDPSCN